MAETIAKVDNSRVPGYAYALVEDGEVKKVVVSGTVRKGSGIPVSEDTTFVLGSVSKSFTALAIMQLVEAGILDLDSPVSLYLTEFAGQPTGKITPRQLLSHTSGFSTLQGNRSQTDLSMAQDALEKRVRALSATTPAHQPESVWEYSNANYQILGRLVEIQSGQAFDDYIKENILKPAGMSASHATRASTTDQQATGHRPWFGSHRVFDGPIGGRGSDPQGGIVSNAPDMARYLSLMMNGEDDILSADGKALMMQPANATSPDYGFGWRTNPDLGVVFHSGASPGFETVATMLPEQKKAVIVLVNASSGLGFGDTAPLRYGISAAALDLPYPGENRTTQKALFIFLALLPFACLIGIVSLLWRRNRPRKLGKVRRYLPWLALPAAIGLAYALIVTIPASFDVPYGVVRMYQPDTGLLLGAGAILSVLWAVVWLVVTRRQASIAG